MVVIHFVQYCSKAIFKVQMGPFDSSKAAGAGVVHVDGLIRDHGRPGYLHQVLVIIVLEAASELMEGHVTRPGRVSKFLTWPRHVSRVMCQL